MNNRIASIDILRALTMVFMIWVNDFWTLSGVPKWLQHANATEDFLGFSDIIFPLFLFIVGLSIPLAIKQRRIKGDSRISISKHIIIRSVSLLFIGFFMVNYETAHSSSMLITKSGWCFLMAIAVGLVWMHWKRSPIAKKWQLPLQLLGILIFIFLAFIYKGGADGYLWMTPQWWGILGLIGWAYLVNALAFVLSRGNTLIMIGFFLLFTLLSVLDHSDNLPNLPNNLSFLSSVYTGTIPAFTSAGIVATLVFRRMANNNSKWILPTLFTLGILSLAFGIYTRPEWGINKIQGTPSWLGICVGIGFILFALFYVLADIKGKVKWSNIIKPAGTATLTCYMLPYLIYPLRDFTGIRLPESLNFGVIGLIGSFIFALLVVLLTGWFEKKGFKLKL
jgi:predicted acyltransferase